MSSSGTIFPATLAAVVDCGNDDIGTLGSANANGSTYQPTAVAVPVVDGLTAHKCWTIEPPAGICATATIQWLEVALPFTANHGDDDYLSHVTIGGVEVPVTSVAFGATGDLMLGPGNENWVAVGQQSSGTTAPASGTMIYRVGPFIASDLANVAILALLAPENNPGTSRTFGPPTIQLSADLGSCPPIEDCEDLGQVETVKVCTTAAPVVGCWNNAGVPTPVLIHALYDRDSLPIAAGSTHTPSGSSIGFVYTDAAGVLLAADPADVEIGPCKVLCGDDATVQGVFTVTLTPPDQGDGSFVNFGVTLSGGSTQVVTWDIWSDGNPTPPVAPPALPSTAPDGLGFHVGAFIPPSLLGNYEDTGFGTAGGPDAANNYVRCTIADGCGGSFVFHYYFDEEGITDNGGSHQVTFDNGATWVPMTGLTASVSFAFASGCAPVGAEIVQVCNTPPSISERAVCVDLGNGQIVEGYVVIGRNPFTLVPMVVRVEDASGVELVGAIVDCSCAPAMPLPQIFGNLYSRSVLGQDGTFAKWNGTNPSYCPNIQWTLDVWVDGVIDSTIVGPTWAQPTSFTFDGLGRPIEPIAWLDSVLAPFGVSVEYIPSSSQPCIRVGMPLPGTHEVYVHFHETLSGGACGAGFTSDIFAWWNNGTTAGNSTDICDTIAASGFPTRASDPWWDTTP